MSIQEIGKLLQNRRKELRLTQVYVAELAGISNRQLLEWEAGRGNPSFTQLQAVLRVLGLDFRIELKSLA